LLVFHFQCHQLTAVQRNRYFSAVLAIHFGSRDTRSNFSHQRVTEQSEDDDAKSLDKARPQIQRRLHTDDIIMTALADMSATSYTEWQDHEYLTASNLNSFFHFGCQLELWKSFHEGHLPRRQESPSSISRPHILRGHQWEKHLVQRLDAQNLILRISKRMSFQAQVEGDLRNHFYVVNSEFKHRNIFRKDYLARKTAPVTFGTFKPDFIEVWKRLDEGRLVVEYHVIDAKASYALHVRASVTVLILDCTSSTSVLLLARSTGSASSRSLRSFNNCFHMVVERG
jgi:hypothetical protein